MGAHGSDSLVLNLDLGFLGCTAGQARSCLRPQKLEKIWVVGPRRLLATSSMGLHGQGSVLYVLVQCPRPCSGTTPEGTANSVA